MRVGAREGFAYHSVKLVLLANGNRCEFDSNTFFPSGKALYPFKVLSCPKYDPFWHLFIPVVCGKTRSWSNSNKTNITDSLRTPK
jgi:hypothetical protein